MKKFYARWKKITERVGDFQATILFSLLYFTIVTPIGLITGLFKDFLNVQNKAGWSETEDNVSSIDKLKLQ